MAVGYSRALKVVVLCLSWYFMSSANNVIGKRFLNTFPYPTTISLSHMIANSFYMYPVLMLLGIPTTINIPFRQFYSFLLPLGFGKLFTSVSSHMSIWRIPVSYAHTVKASMPIFTVLLARILMKEKQSMLVYLSLFPIFAGVSIATVTELSFELYGMIWAISCTIGFAIQNICSKKALKELHLNHLHLLMRMAHIAFVTVVPFWLLTDSYLIWQDKNLQNSDNIFWFVTVLALSGFINFCQNIMAFSVLNLVSPLSYSVANSTKRILVITVSLLTLKNPVTSVNVFGMMLAIFGVFLYNRVFMPDEYTDDTLDGYRKSFGLIGDETNSNEKHRLQAKHIQNKKKLMLPLVEETNNHQSPLRHRMYNSKPHAFI